MEGTRIVIFNMLGINIKEKKQKKLRGPRPSMLGNKNAFGSKRSVKERVEISKRMSGKNNPNYGNHKLAGKNHPMWGKLGFWAGKKNPDQSKRMVGKYAGKNNPMFGVYRYGKDNPMWNKKHSKVTREKMSASQKRRFKNKENHLQCKN